MRYPLSLVKQNLAQFLSVLLVATAPSAWPQTAPAQPRESIRLWRGTAPGDANAPGSERDTTPGSTGALVAGRTVVRLGNVSDPTLTIYKPSAAVDTRRAVLVFPGGGYSILAMDLEGTEVCEWLNTLGITAILVKYRVPAQQNSPRKQAPLQDAQRAMSLVRHGATRWNIDPRHVGVLGFSAGAHLAAMLSTHFDSRVYATVDEADSEPLRPDFAMLIYPAYLANGPGDTLSPELTVSSGTPSTFLVQAEDDGVKVENSLVYYGALRRAGVPAEMHLFSQGGHGYGLRRTALPVTNWPLRAAEWLARSPELPASQTPK